MTAATGPIIDWWRRRRRNSARIDKIRHYPSTAEVPARIGRHIVAIAGDPPAWAVIECPCGHGHRLTIRILPRGRDTVWHLDQHKGGPSLHPSVDVEAAERRCHFWLRHGRVRWVSE